MSRLPRQILFVEGAPGLDIPNLCHTLTRNTQALFKIQPPDTPLERIGNLLEQPGNLLVMQSLIPHLLDRDHPRKTAQLAKLEPVLAAHKAYVFFLRASVGYYSRRFASPAEAEHQYRIQQLYERGYALFKLTGHKFVLAADGHSFQDLARAIMYQSRMILYPLESSDQPDLPD